MEEKSSQATPGPTYPPRTPLTPGPSYSPAPATHLSPSALLTYPPFLSLSRSELSHPRYAVEMADPFHRSIVTPTLPFPHCPHYVVGDPLPSERGLWTFSHKTDPIAAATRAGEQVILLRSVFCA